MHLSPSAGDMKALRSTQEREGREKGGFPENEGFLGPGGMRKRFALAALRLPSQVETSTGGRYFVRRASHPR